MSACGPRVKGYVPGGSKASAGPSPGPYTGFTSMPDSSVRRSMGQSYGAAARRGGAASERPAGALERVERDAEAGGDVRPDRVAGELEIARLERFDDAGVLGHEVLASLEPAAADHLHHQVHRELAVERREQRVAREVDLVLVEGGVRRVPFGVRDGGNRRVQELAEARELRAGEPPDGVLCRVQLERDADVVALLKRVGRHGG